MPKNLEIDNTDLKILQILAEDASVPYTEIAQRVFVSDGTVHVRMKKLKEMGVVKGSQLIIDYAALGWDVTAFVGIYLEKSSQYEPVVEALRAISEIINLNYTTGAYSIFAKLVCRDTKQLMEILHGKVQNIVGIQRTETFISLEEPINRHLML